MCGGKVARSPTPTPVLSDVPQRRAPAQQSSGDVEKFAAFYKELHKLKNDPHKIRINWLCESQGNRDLIHSTNTLEAERMGEAASNLEYDVNYRLGHKSKRYNEKMSQRAPSRADRIVGRSVRMEMLQAADGGRPAGVFRRIRNLFTSRAKLQRQIQSYRRESRSLTALYECAADVKTDAIAASEAYKRYAKLRDMGKPSNMSANDYARRLAKAHAEVGSKLDILKVSRTKLDGQIATRRAEVGRTRSRFRLNPMRHVDSFKRNSDQIGRAIDSLEARLAQDTGSS